MSRTSVWSTVVIMAACVQWGCHLGRPPHAHLADNGTVWAETPQAAKFVAEKIDEIVPAIRSMLDVSSDTHLEVWVVEDAPTRYWWPASLPYEATADRGRGRIWLRASSPQAVLVEVLAHEVVHVCLEDPVDSGIPWAVEEGLCNVIALGVAASETGEGSRVWQTLAALWAVTSVEPTFRVMIRDRDSPEFEWQIGSVGLASGRPEIMPRPRDLLAIAKEPSSAAVNVMGRGVGSFILYKAVERHGLEETVREVTRLGATKATLDQWWEALVGMAGLSPDGAAWQEGIMDGLSADALRLALLRMGPILGTLGQDDGHRSVAAMHASAAAVRRAYPTESIEEMWVLAAPVLILEGTDLRVRLKDITPLAEVFERAWVEVSAACAKLSSP